MRSLNEVTGRGRTLGTMALMVCLASGATSCGKGGPEPTPMLTSLVVRNLSSFDVNVYAVRSPVAPPIRLGTVVGTSNATFPIGAMVLQPGGFLVVRVHAIGGQGTWTSPSVAVDDGVIAVLDVTTDAFGDCSTSSLHTILVRDTVGNIDDPHLR